MEPFNGVNSEAATLSIVVDGLPHLYVETVADGQAAWTYDIFFAGPRLADVPELVVVDEGRGTQTATKESVVGCVAGKRCDP